MKRSSLSLAVVLLMACAGMAGAAQLNFASPVTVLAADVASGPSFTVMTAMTATDMLSISVSGFVCLQPDGAYCTNAAGIISTGGVHGEQPGTAYTTPTIPPYSYGALLFGNSSLGFVQLFPSSVANGLGDTTPPDHLMLNATLGSLGFASGIGAGQVMEFRVADELNAITDNTVGSFVITNVPEPGTTMLVAAGVLMLAGLRRRKA